MDDPAVLLYVDAVLRARDALLLANIKVVRYDLYPNGRGALRIFNRDRDRALASLTANGIPFATKPTKTAADRFIAVWRRKK